MCSFDGVGDVSWFIMVDENRINLYMLMLLAL